MKKTIAIFLLILMIPFTLCAGSLFEASIGATAAYQKANAIEEISSGNFNISDIKVDDFKFGADTNINLLFLNINGKAFLAFSTEDQFAVKSVNGIVSANLLVNLSIIRLKAGLGYQYALDVKSLKSTFGSTSVVSAFDEITKANFDIYAGADIALGKLLISAYATLPTNVSIDNGNWKDLLSTVKDNWKAAQLGVSLSYIF